MRLPNEPLQPPEIVMLALLVGGLLWTAWILVQQ
jgi:hypothetical protein